jgi:hypothetical protein
LPAYHWPTPRRHMGLRGIGVGSGMTREVLDSHCTKKMLGKQG